MIRINLLPFRAARKKENVRRQISIFLLSLLFISVALVYYNIRLSSEIDVLNAKREKTKKELNATEKKARQVDNIKRQLNLLKKKRGVIDSLQINRREPVQLVDAMTQLVIPGRMWFTNFTFSGRNVNITGTALDNQTVADFMIRLERSGLFSGVNLKAVKKAGKGSRNLKSFSISCRKRPMKKKTAPKKKAQKGKARKK